MNEIKVFNYESAAIRTVSIAGEPWWVAKDVCDVIGLTNPSESMNRLEEDEKSTLRISEGGSPANIVNESGLYSLILRSTKPEAKAFKKWITSEVLPSIRKTGKYSIVKDMTGGFPVPRTYAEALRLAADQADQIERMLPKAQVFDRIADAKGHKSIQEVAAQMNIGSNTLFAILRDKGILFREGSSNLPKREHIEAGRFIVVEEPFRVSGEDRVYSRTRVTPKGELWLAQIIEKGA